MRTLAVESKNLSNKSQISVENMKPWLRTDDPKKDFFVELRIRDGQGDYLGYLNRQGVQQLINALIGATIADEEYQMTKDDLHALEEQVTQTRLEDLPDGR